MEHTERRPSGRARTGVVRALIRAAPWRLAVFGLVVACGLLATLTLQFLPSRYALNEGDVSPYDIKSPTKVTYVSQIRTQAARTRAAAAVPDVYRPVPNADALAQDRATTGLGEVTQIRGDGEPSANQVTQLTQLHDVSLTPEVAGDILAMDDLQWSNTITATLRILDRTMRTQIPPDQLSTVKTDLAYQLDPSLTDRQATVTLALVRSFLGPTEVVDEQATAAARAQAADAIQPVQVTIEAGETIVRNGDIVTAGDVEMLDAAGLRNPTIQWSQIAAMGLVSAALSLLLCAYLYRFYPQTARSPRRLLLLGTLLIAAPLAAKLTIPGRVLYAYLFPIAAVPMLIAILLDAQLGLVVTMIQAVSIGLVVNNGMEPVVAGLVAGGLGALCVYRIERINVFTLAAVVVAAGNLVVIAAFSLAASSLDLNQLVLYAGLALVSGALSAALTLGTVSFLGHLFDIATTMNLLELAHPSQPLFRRLLTEAPGTYHHSVVVANLAERAAAAVGADTLLSRIGGYYHDIGKLTRPYAFVENQVGVENVHDRLDPYTSARIILDHVPDGLHLAAKYGLPARVQDLIAQHHGTTAVQFFYRLASKEAGQPVDLAAFQYAGPRPQSREAGIMMLADSVEAAVRANRDHAPENIAAIVDMIVRERIDGGQLDECALTLSDLQKIRTAFLSVLQGIFHPRVEYPPEVARAPKLVGGGR
jgi:putative nucleotidyltransferase with HDIG domain